MESKKNSVDRRGFLRGAAAAAGAAGLVAKPPIALAQQGGPASGREAATHATVDRRSVRTARLRLHGRRHQVARHRILRRQSRLELPRPARIDDQLRRQHEPGVAHLLPRRIVGRDGARLRQDRRQADDDHGARHRRACSTPPWRSTTPTATACPMYIVLGNILDVNYRRGSAEWVPQRAGRRRDGARLHQVGRHAGLALALRRIRRARLQDRDDAAL